MTHTPAAHSLLTEAARLRAKAQELAPAAPVREVEELRYKASQIEARVLIKARQVPVFQHTTRDCAAAVKAAERVQVLARVKPDVRAVLEDIQTNPRYTGRA